MRYDDLDFPSLPSIPFHIFLYHHHHPLCILGYLLPRTSAHVFAQPTVIIHLIFGSSLLHSSYDYPVPLLATAQNDLSNEIEYFAAIVYWITLVSLATTCTLVCVSSSRI